MSVSHFSVLRDQLIEDIRNATVLGPSATVHFGAPRREIREMPCAVVSTKRVRGGVNDGIRSMGEVYEFTISLRQAVPDPYPETGYETTTMALADALILLLIPASTVSVPADAGAYAGVTNMRYVTSVESMNGEDSDGFIEVQLVFEVIATVYQ